MKTKIITETVTLPTYWAIALINGDFSGCSNTEEWEIREWMRHNPQYGACLDASEESNLKLYDGYLTSCLEYTFPVEFTRASGELEYLIYPVTPFYDPLDWQLRGLQYTASGHGSKIPTTNCVYVAGRKYRIYCRVFSNAGTFFINFQGRRVIIA